MSAAKIGLLVGYVILAALAVTQAGTTVGTVATWIIGILVVAHLVEAAVFFKLCKEAPGSTAGNLLNVLVFGVLHANEMKKGITA